MKKEALSKLLALTVFLFPALHAADSSNASQEAKRPNIILVMADDQGWRDVAYNADPDKGLQTPHMDQMASEGIRFNRFYASSPNCSPTRAGILTGRHPNRSGVFNPGLAMRPEELTIAEILQKAGYATAHFGKWHLGPVKAESPFNPNKQGFDHFVSHDNFFDLDPELSRNGASPETFSGDGSEVIVEEALKHMDMIKDQNQPFFHVIWFGSPHTNHEALQKDMDLYPDLPKNWQRYFGEITAMDRAMGNLRTGLKNKGFDENTLIWYTSDNGSYEPATTIEGLRGSKGMMYEGGIRVPTFIVWPGQIRKPMETEMRGTTLDIMPTLMDLLGITLENRELDGMSLLPLLQGKEMDNRPVPLSFWRESTGKSNETKYTEEDLIGWWRPFICPTHTTPRTEDFGGWSAWIEGKWKLHHFKKKYQLYDLDADPAETNDLAAQRPEVVQNLAKKLYQWQCSVEVSLTGADNEIEPTIKMR